MLREGREEAESDEHHDPAEVVLGSISIHNLHGRAGYHRNDRANNDDGEHVHSGSN